MILQALYSYYVRLQEDPNSGIALPGFAPKKISFAIILDKKGNLLQVQDIRDTTGKKPVPLEIIVPEGEIKTSGISANFLWDNTGYVLGIDSKGKPERTKKTFDAFVEKQKDIGFQINDDGMHAVLSFLDSWQPEKSKTLKNIEEILDKNIVFRLDGVKGFIHERKAIKEAWLKYKNELTSESKGLCLITGGKSNISPLHNPIKGIYDPGGQAEKRIVSFNLDSFCSFGKKQNFNAPVSESAAFAYTTALNHLLRYESQQRIRIGDATTVFWTNRPSPIENMFGQIMDPRSTEGADTKPVADYLHAVRAGKKPVAIEDESVKFFILGLAPNASRIAIRFWYADTIESLNKHIGSHFDSLSIVRNYDNEAEFPGIWQLLIETAVLRKSENINPLLSGALIRSILTEGKYPISILSSIIERIRSDHDVNYYRAALIKAVLIRNFGNREVNMALNEEATNIAYRLGRLFAVLEKAQEEAIPGANATIKDRFFGSASSTPRVVFPQLLRLSQHHLTKIETGSKIYKEQLIQTIMDGLSATDGFPGFLKLEDQGLFVIGYYHQRKAFFTKREETAK